MRTVLDRINTFWHKLSRNGLREDEGILTYREVIFLNRLMFVSPIIMIFYIPVEIIVNGLEMVPFVVGFVLMLFIPVITNRFRLFSFSKHYTFIISNLFITAAGISVGEGTYNHMAYIAIVLMGVILFKSNLERILVFLTVSVFFTIQLYAYKNIDPIIYVPADIKKTFSVIFFFMALLINFLLAFYFVGLNREYEAIIEEQKDNLSNKNKEITDSIAYAKRIQKAILPSEKVRAETLPEHFIFYQPKDIVAGDFYWIEKTKTNLLIAAADCTGHGVPGAMVSVVCHNALNRSVREFGLKDPNTILDKTKELIVEEFEKSDEEIKDGMDISLCSLSEDGKTLEWAGANNPIVILRNQEVIELKPDKQPVGKFDGSKPFTSHRIDLLKGDMIYLFSDGYADQFGGPNGKKFKYKNLIALLKSIHDQPCDEQSKKLKENFQNWTGNLEQLDDICLIGMRVS